MIHTIQCSCGALEGTLSNPETLNRAVCYCRDCQAFAHFLKRSDEILDNRGGSDIVQTLPRHITFTQGAENLACMRLTEKGLMRWYARCCNTPIGNTMATHKVSFVGLLHNCLEQGGANLNTAIGPVTASVHVQSARGEPKPAQYGMAGSTWRLGSMMLRALINGSYRQTPFFGARTGKPVVTPLVLTAQQRELLMQEVSGARA